MSVPYIVPEWFFGLGISFEILFSLITLVVAVYAFKVYRLSEQRETKLLMFSFLFISASYLIKAILNSYILAQVKENLGEVSLNNLNLIGMVGLYSHIILFSLGLITLTYLTFKICNGRAYSLLALLGFLVIFSSRNGVLAFGYLTSILLFYICIHYLVEYNKNKKLNTLLLFVAFVSLFLSGVSSSIVDNYYINFTIGHVLEFGSYLFILISLLLTIRKK